MVVEGVGQVAGLVGLLEEHHVHADVLSCRHHLHVLGKQGDELAEDLPGDGRDAGIRLIKQDFDESWQLAEPLRRDDPEFATAFLDVAVAGDMAIPWSLPRLIGASRARALSFMPRKLDAAEARWTAARWLAREARRLHWTA